MITLEAVSKKYGDMTAVDNASYSVGKGDAFALLGPNGAGKTTTVRMLLDFIKPSAGRILINGRSSSDPQSRKNVAYVAEQHMIPPYLTGYQYLKRHAALTGMSGKAVRTDIGRVVEMVSMTGHEKKKASDYSKGMRQRMGLAAALMGKPELLILDEPVSGLDPIGIRDVRKIIEHLSASGVTVMINSHLLSEVEKTCKTAAIMYKGKILVKDAIANIVKDGETLEDVFIRYIENE